MTPHGVDPGPAAVPAVLPAWSEAFHGATAPDDSLVWPTPITRDWAFGDRTGRGVRVAVVDSGIDASHPDVGELHHAVAVELDRDRPGETIVTTGAHDDLYGHGTACASVIRSIAPEVELVSVRVLGADLKGSAIAFAEGLRWCLDNDIDVVNLSLSTSNLAHLETFHELVDRAAFARTFLVSAMSNERRRSIPSEFAGVFSVACAPGDDREVFWIHPSGPAEWGAPGIDTEVAWRDGATLRVTGNSFAAPVIAGHLARLRSTHPGLTTWQARSVLAALAANAAR